MYSDQNAGPYNLVLGIFDVRLNVFLLQLVFINPQFFETGIKIIDAVIHHLLGENGVCIRKADAENPALFVILGGEIVLENFTAGRTGKLFYFKI
jgi:hypothetical protein